MGGISQNEAGASVSNPVLCADVCIRIDTRIYP